MARVVALLCGLFLVVGCSEDTSPLEGSNDDCRLDTDCSDGETCVFTTEGCSSNVRGRCSTNMCDDQANFRIYCSCQGRDRVFGDPTCSPEQYIFEQTNSRPCEGVVHDGGPTIPASCNATSDCPTSYICEFTPNSCGQTGTCRLRSTCIGDGGIGTFCGCDGVTFQGATFCIEQPFMSEGACAGDRDGGIDGGM